MLKRNKIIIFASSIILIFIVGGLIFVKQFFNAFAPPKIEINTEYISTDRNFINGLTIEMIRADSIGENGYPIEYTTFYTTTCNIQHSKNDPPNPPSKIFFNEISKYTWDVDTISVKYIHNSFSRELKSSSDNPFMFEKYREYPTCPLKFEAEQWYFFTIGDPQVTGIFFFIEKKGKDHQYILKSGLSPI